jgi:hypothetical protein
MLDNLSLEWKLSDEPIIDIGIAFIDTTNAMVDEQLPELADLFPFKNHCEVMGHLSNNWVSVRLKDRKGARIPMMGAFKENADEVVELTEKLSPFFPRSHQTLYSILGTSWFSFDTFTYVGPYSAPFACWPDATKHLQDWLNHLVLPEVLRRNEARVLRAVPQPPQYSLENISHALWILECENEHKQGTAFHLSGVGLVTCQHVLGSASQAFRANDFDHKYPIKVRAENRDIDLAILNIDKTLENGLTMGSADNLRQMDHLLVAGFPNYRIGDTGVTTPGLITGFRMKSGIRRILTNAPIIAGASGSPVIDRNNSVIGVAVTGADMMENAGNTENHGIIPIDALQYLSNNK